MRHQARSTVDSCQSNGIAVRLVAALPRSGSGAPLFGLLALVLGAVIALSATPALADTCPNEQLRSENNSTGLPDCRAYEQVSPRYKEGHVTFTTQGYIGESSVLTPSFGVFAGTEDANAGAFATSSPYQFSRGASGWEATALSPSATEFESNFSNVRLASTDLSAVAFFLSKRSTPNIRELYVREQDGTLVDLGLTYAPGVEFGEESISTYFRAGSKGLTHILTTSNTRWPGDTSVSGEGLYEYLLGGTEPRLVAVKNEGALQSNTEAELIGRCGVRVHFEEGAYHEMSNDGEAIFFGVEPCFESPGEPEVEEIYARLGGVKTLPISEPELPAGESCTGTCAAAAKAEPHLEQATESGKQIFFSTEQPLVNEDKDSTRDLYEVEISGQGASSTVSKVIDLSKGGTGDATLGEGAELLGMTGTADDASRVYLVARGELTDVPNSFGDHAEAGSPNLYMVEPATGKTVFIATLSNEDSFDWGEPYIPFRVTTHNGRYLTFSSFADLTPDDTSSGLWQLFQYDAQSNNLTRVSVGEEGFDDDGNTSEDFTLLGEARSVSEDGAVFFSTSKALTPGATADPEHLLRNIYEYKGGHVYLIAAGSTLNYLEPTESATRLWGSDEDGENVYFQSGSALVPSDADTQIDLYDARVNGGFPVPSVSRCEGESCQGPVSATPVTPAAGSSTFSGPGNQKPKKKKHKKKKHKKKSGKHQGQKKGGSR